MGWGTAAKMLILLDTLAGPRFQYSKGVDRAVSGAAVRVAGLVKRFGRREALGGVDLEVAPGEAFGLVGANGAGKTTLIKCMLDFCAADAGSVQIFGVASSEARARARLAARHAEDLHAAGVRSAEIEHALDQRGLAGAVGAHQAEGLARRHLEVDAAQRLAPAEALDQARDAHRSAGYRSVHTLTILETGTRQRVE